MKIFSQAVLIVLGLLLLAVAIWTDLWVIRIILIVAGVLIIVPHTQKWTTRVLLSILGLVLLVWLLLQTELVQNFIIDKVTQRLSQDLNTEVQIGHVGFSLFDKMDLDSTLMRDRQKDTLLYAGTMKLRVTDWFFLKSKTDLKYIGLEDAVINMHRKDSIWNFQFIVDYFSAPKTKTDTSAKNIGLNIERIDLKRVTLIMINDRAEDDCKSWKLLLDAKNVDLGNNKFLIDSVEMDRPYFSIENFDGLRPVRHDKTSNLKDTGLYFNAGDIHIEASSVKITNGVFVNFIRGEVSDKGVFDAANIKVNKINGELRQLSFIKDTIKAKIDLNAVERSGFELKKLKADFKFTPQVMEFANMDLRTPRTGSLIITQCITRILMMT